ncbi:putative ATP-dependent RNA helicase DDX49 [Halotydeus destructor]|nr:putative ATP-dependent RNA helicase DDX49 [Halotydeus destructor]
MATFKSLGLSNWLIKSLSAMGIDRPSTIQQEGIPQILQFKSDGKTRRDVFACSRTGSGKTLAYVLPILEVLVQDPRPYFALILAPTRELAYQINEMIKVLTGASQSGSIFMVKSLLVIGGGSYGNGENAEEAQGLWFGKPNIVVATPGRLLEQLENRNHLGLCGQMRTLRFDMLVLDEADQLISPSFSEQLKGILKWIDSNDSAHGLTNYRKRQTLVFSATLTSALEQLKEVISRKDPENQPCIINILPTIEKLKQEIATTPYLDQRYILCPEYVRTAYVVEILLDIKFNQLIIFCHTKKEARLLHKVLMTLGFSGDDFGYNPVLLNSDMKQALRFAALDKFKSMKSRILVTTDIANRGLDIPLVDLVINFTCPKAPIAYVHRVGRTCRTPDFSDQNQLPSSSSSLDKLKGKAITLISQYDINLIQNIEAFIGKKLEKEDAVDDDNITTILKKVAMAIKEAEISMEYEERIGDTDDKKDSKKRKFRRSTFDPKKKRKLKKNK